MVNKDHRKEARVSLKSYNMLLSGTNKMEETRIKQAASFTILEVQGMLKPNNCTCQHLLLLHMPTLVIILFYAKEYSTPME